MGEPEQAEVNLVERKVFRYNFLEMNTARNFLISLLAGAIGGWLILSFGSELGITQPLTQDPAPAPAQLPISEQKDAPVLPGISSHEQAVTAAVKTASPAVVSIVLTADVPVLERSFGSPFEELFGERLPFEIQVPQLQQRGTQRQEIGGGSGFLVSPDGLILTNRHVVDRENVQYTVFTNDGKRHEAKLVTRDPSLDLAVVKIEGTNFPFLGIGNSDELITGQTVIAIGNALAELHNTVSVGVISGLSRSIVAGDELGQAELLEQVVQTDAAINPGNSGGPLLNLRGQAMAVNVAVAFGSENIGFAIPINEAQAVIEAAKSGKKISRAFLGVRHIQITPALKEQENLPVDHGALIVRGEGGQELAVTPGSPADKAGLTENDIILEIDGVKLDEAHSLASQIRRKQVGQGVRLKILHDGQEREVSVTLDELPE
mgnify:FL=1